MSKAAIPTPTPSEQAFGGQRHAVVVATTDLPNLFAQQARHNLGLESILKVSMAQTQLTTISPCKQALIGLCHGVPSPRTDTEDLLALQGGNNFRQGLRLDITMTQSTTVTTTPSMQAF
eukprot:RCo023904